MVKTRFAPSPTGFMHIGNLRTALYAYLIARKNNGHFILRIEDTDQQRLVEGAVDVIKDTLRVTGLKYDEGPDVGGDCGPYIQSERLPIYMEYAKKLVAQGDAYYCFCSKERLDSLHEEDEHGGYDRHCRNLTKEEVEEKLASGIPWVIRQKMPLEGTTSYDDAVFGTVSVENAELQDQILMKADGFPTYNFCHVIDDHLMGVTHVVRGSEYLASTPKYALLYDSYGWERPTYVHLPLLMGKNEDGSVSKLSKRHGAVSCEDLMNNGYLPEAIMNYIALLGWAPKGEQEIYTLRELEQEFDIAGISKSPAVFDYEKLLYFNGEYIRKLSPEAFYEKAKPYMKAVPESMNKAKIASLIQPRVETLVQITDKVSFFAALPDYELELFENKKNKVTLESAKQILVEAMPVLETIVEWENDTLFSSLSMLAERLTVKTGAVMWAVRIAVSGLAATPGGATEILELLGKNESLMRVQKAIDRL